MIENTQDALRRGTKSRRETHGKKEDRKEGRHKKETKKEIRKTEKT